MKTLRVSFLCTALLINYCLSADTIDRNTDINVDDVKAIREWLNTKRQVTVKEKGGALSIAGEVHTEFQIANEVKDGCRQRGPNAATGTPNKSFDVEADFMMDYRTERTWAAIKLRFDNNAGIFGGTKDRISLERAYLGARLVEEENYTIDVEMGRRRMGNIFDSKIEFDNFFDGILVSYDTGIENIGNFYFHTGPFIIDERENHYGYVGEVGLFNIANTGFYSKYSLIDWDTHHYPCKVDQKSPGGRVEVSLFDVNDRFRFLVSQLLLGYRYIPQPLNRVVIFYLAGLYNHKAKRVEQTGFHKYNWGGYIGFSIGELKKKDDWSFDANYQFVAPQAIPDFDIAGIGLGNAASTGLYTANLNGTGKPTTRRTATGNGNFRGYQLTLQYLLTNNITLFQSWQQSQRLYEVGPFRRYKQYEIEFIYGF